MKLFKNLFMRKKKTANSYTYKDLTNQITLPEIKKQIRETKFPKDRNLLLIEFIQQENPKDISELKNIIRKVIPHWEDYIIDNWYIANKPFFNEKYRF